MKISNALLSLVSLLPLYAHTLVAVAPKDGATHINMLNVNHVTAVKPSADIETVNHVKKKNAGYSKGSPLYNKQKEFDKASAGKGGKKQKSAPHEEAALPPPSKMPRFREYLASVSVYSVLVLAFAFVYKTRFMQDLGAKGYNTPSLLRPTFLRCGFAYSCFDFRNLQADWPMCLWAWCCPIVQWAGTASASKTPFLSYWEAVMFMLVMVALSPFTYGLTGLVALAVVLVRRRQLRKVYNHTRSDNKSWLEDFCFVFCCNPFLCCQLMQEAREVAYADEEAAYRAPLTPSDAPQSPVVPVVCSAPNQGHSLSAPGASHRMVQNAPGQGSMKQLPTLYTVPSTSPMTGAPQVVTPPNASPNVVSYRHVQGNDSVNRMRSP